MTDTPPVKTPPPASRRSRIGGAIVLVLITGMAGGRIYLQRKQQEDRERMMQSLAESSRKSFQDYDERIREENRRQTQEELTRSIKKLEEIQKQINLPPSLPEVRPSSAAPAPEPPRRSSVEMPHHFVVSNADLARAAVDGAEAKDWNDRAARKELVALFNELHAELRKLLGDRERFPDNAPVAAMLPRVEAALPRIEAAMKPGDWKKMAVRNVTDFRDDLRDFAAAGKGGGDAGTP